MRIISIAVTSIFAAGLAFAAQAALAGGPTYTRAGPQINYRGCVYYQHANFQGMRQSIGAGMRRAYVGDQWNDQISSIACNRADRCRLIVHEHRDYRGAQRIFYPNTSYVGDEWNDRISSMAAQCDGGKGAGGE